MSSIKPKRIVITLLLIMQCSVVAQAQQIYFRTVEGVSHLPVFADTAAVPASKEAGALIYSTADGKPMIYSGLAWADAGGGVFTLDTTTTPDIVYFTDGLTTESADFIFGSDQLDDDGDTTHDYRMFFDKSKGAFRAGYVTGTEWNAANVGVQSFATGKNTTASGLLSTAMGTNTTASGAASIAMGDNTIASSTYSTAMGYSTDAGAQGSTAMGWETIASGDFSTTMGRSTDASGLASTAMGYSTDASGTYSTAMGQYATASGFDSTAMGRDTTASGSYSTAMGYSATASGISSIAMGSSATASGNYSTAMGYSTDASVQGSTAMGWETTASGSYSTAMGRDTTASGTNSTAMGYYTTAQAYDSVVLGRYNVITGTTGSWVATEPLFVIGNGADAGNPANALTVLKNGNMEVQGTLKVGAYTLPNTDGAANQLLRTDGSGTVTWASPSSNALSDNVTDALDIQQGTDDYINIDTTDGSEAIAFGNVVTNPAYSFAGSGDVTVGGDLTATGDIAINGGDITSTGALTVTPNAGANLNVALSTTGDFIVNTDDLVIDTSTGNVGLGVTSPTEKLDVRNGAIRVGYDTDTFDQLIQFFRNWTMIGAIDNDASDLRIRSWGGQDLKFADDEATRMIIKDGGLIGIGTSSPSSALDIVGDLEVGGTDFFVDDSEGKVGIGTITPGVELDVSGDIRTLAQGDIRLADSDSTNYVGFQSPLIVTTDVIWTLPAADGTLDQVLKTDGAGALSWTTISGSITDGTTANNTLRWDGSVWVESAVLTNDGTDVTVTGDATVTGADLTLGAGTTAAAGTIVLHDNQTLDSYTTTIASNADVDASFTLTLPADDGDASQFLQTDGSGALSWVNGGFTLDTTTTPDKLYFTDGLTTESADFIFGSDQLNDDGDTTHDNRMFFDKSKGAFRAGSVVGTEWDAANVGDKSFATGSRTTASEFTSFAAGYSTTASGSTSTAIGYGTTASGVDSTAMGNNTTASGDRSTAMGRQTTASGIYSTAMGYDTDASGERSTAMGSYTYAKAYASVVLGRWNVIEGTTDSWVATDPVFVIGNGADGGNRANALTVFKNSDFVVGSSQLDDDTGSTIDNYRMFFDKSKGAFRAGHVEATEWDAANVGDYSFAAGDWTTASGEASFAMGRASEATGDYSTAMGWATNATGWGSTAMGTATTASGDYSTAIGNLAVASGNKSIAIGDTTTATGLRTIAMGNNTTAQAYGSLVLGWYNVVSGSAENWVASDPLFVIGNGADDLSRANALTVLKNGNIGIGVADPDAKLEVNGQIKITGGSPGSGKILTSDADGKATWDTEINDQTASNYFDIGTMRQQWGNKTITSDSVVTVTMPASFANSTYVVTISVDDSWTTGGNVAAAMIVEAKTPTTFGLDRDNDVTGTIKVDWIAIGLKP